MSNLFTPPKFAKSNNTQVIGVRAMQAVASFRECAEKSGWSLEDTDMVIQAAIETKDYFNFCTVILDHLED